MYTQLRFNKLLAIATLFVAKGVLAVGLLQGVVRDANTNEPIESVTVIVKSAAGEEQIAISGEAGGFSVANLNEGSYTVSATFAGATAPEQIVLVGPEGTTNVVLLIDLSTVSAESYTIEVTGSLLGATSRDTAIPIYGVDRLTTLREGNPTILDQVKNNPIVGRTFGDNNPFNSDAQFRAGSGTINLRGLGPQRTLMLLNGKRFSANNITAPDSHLLPSSVIGRVEILKDGAAATYGSDAIAGVVNFFTRQDVEGLELSADYRQITGSAGDVNASAAYGWTFDKGNVLLSAGYQYRGELTSLQRDWTNQPYNVNSSRFSPYNNPGLWQIIGRVNNVPTPIGAALDANCQQMGGTISFSGNTPICFYPFNYNYNLVNTTHQAQAYGEFNAKINASTKIHLEGLYGMTYLPTIPVNASWPPLNGPNGPGTFFFVPGNNPGFATFLAQTNPTLPPGIAPIGAAGALWGPFGMGGNPLGDSLGRMSASNRNDVVRFAGDLSGKVGIHDLHYKLGATYLKESQYGNIPDVLVGRLQAALNGLGGPNCKGTTPGQNGCQFFNPFSNALASNPVAQQNNPGFVQANANDSALVGWMTDQDRFFELRNELAVLDGLIDGSIPWKLPGGKPMWAVGAQYRSTTSITSVANPFNNALATPCVNPGDSSCVVKSGPYTFFGQYTPSKINQDVYALFHQVDFPLFNQWKTSIGWRWEDYRGQTGGTFNPQVRSKWQIADFIALRGSFGTSFRGPTTSDIAPGTYVTQQEQIPVAGNLFRANDRVGNPDLLAEKAITFNVGTVLQFLQNKLTTTFDYWFYKLDNQITYVPANLIAAAVAGPGNGRQFVDCSSPLRDRITFANNNTCVQGTTTASNIFRIRSDTVNGPSVTTMGLDMELDYLIENVFKGSLNLGGFASVALNYHQDPFVLNGVTISDAYDAVGYTNYDRLPGTLPRWRGNFFVNYNHGWHNFRITTNYIDGVKDNRGPIAIQTGATGALAPNTLCTIANAEAGSAPNCTISTFGVEQKGFVSLDAAYQLSLPWDMTVTVSAQNLIGMDPPGARLPFGYDPSMGSPLGRTFKFAIAQKF